MGGSTTKTATTSVDPYEDMPPWLEDSYRDDVAFRKMLLESGQGVAEELGNNPQEIYGPSGWESGALDEVLMGGDVAAAFEGIGADRLGADYGAGYVDDVVETTLAGMDRQAQRDALARESSNAAIGGVSNSRTAVGEAVAGSLHAQDRAAMEAKLRDEGFRFSSEMGLEEAGLANQFANDALSRSAAVGSAMSGYGELDRNLAQAGSDAERNSQKDALSWLSSLYSSSAVSKGPTGQTTTQQTPGPNTFSQILGLGASALGGYMAVGSDEELKEDIVDLDGSEALGNLRKLRSAEYRYKDDAAGVPGYRDDRHAGLIAQSAEEIPGAVVRGEDGMRHVAPYPVLATIVGAVQELDRRISEDG